MSNEFPAFIKAEYVEGDAFSRFQQDVTRTLDGTKQRFERSFSEISNVISNAISRPAGAGRLDLGLPDFRQAAADARLYQASIEATLNSARTLAQATGEVSARTQSYIQALMAQNNEAKQAVTTADAQVATYTRLQTALNATADANSKLAQAQREVYAEQARAAQIEVQQRNRQAGLNAVFAPGLTRRAVDNGAGFSALDGLAQQQAEAERAAASLLALQQAEAGAAEGARILGAALQGTALATDRTAKSARESAAVFEQAFAAQERAAREAAAAQQVLAASAAQLRAELDPMFAAQQRFNTALDRAEELFKAGTISTREYEQAQAQARQQLQAHAQALFTVEQAQGRGTTATRINTESQRANRFAMIQAGQQLQDITVSLQSGQRATTVFAQQLPQLAFAFTDVGGKVGAFAQFLAGPWGVAVFGAVTALGFFIEHLVTAGQESDDLNSKSLALSQALDKETFATKEGLQALKDFNAEKERARAADSLAIDDSIRKAEARRREALATREALQAEIERAAQANPGSRFDDGSGGAFEFGRSIRIAGLESRLEANQQRIDELNKSLGNLGIDKAVQDAKALSDPIEAINQRFDKMADAAKRAAAGTYLVGDAMRKASNDALKKTLADIEKQRQAEIDAQRDRDRASSSTRAPSLPPVTMSEVANILGAPITSGLRTQAQNRAVGGAPNSLHLIGQAIDIPLTVNGRPLTKAGIRSALEAAGVKVREILGPGDAGHDDHFHVGFDRKRQRPDQIASAAGREADEAARQLEQLAGRVQNLQDRFDPATKAANEFAEALRTIKDAEGAGIISERQSFDLQIAAMAEQAGKMAELQRQETERFMKVFEPQQLRTAADDYADYIAQKWESSQRNAANAFVNAVEAVDFVSALLRGQARGRDALRLINPSDRRMTTGANREDVLGQFLFGKTSNFREEAEGKPPIQGGFAQSYTKHMTDLKDAFGGALEKVMGKNAAGLGEVFGAALAGSEIGTMTHDLIEGFGIKTSKLGSQIGGAIGSAFGPIGSIIGSIVVGAGVEALKPTKRGSATITGVGGELIVSSSRGNSKARVGKSVETAGEAISTLERIADALGATVDPSRGSVSIGIRGDKFRVDTSGRGITKTKRGAVDFGDDSAAAIRFATMDLIKDGVIVGLRDSTQRVLQSSKDLDTAIQRAVDFENVFQQLRERKDPVGAAIDTLDKEFQRLRNIFAQAGASVEEYAQLEELYGMRRKEAIEQANEQVFGSLKALLDDLRFGDNGRSLRDRLAAAQAKFDPLAARVQAGDITAYDDFAEAARALLDIQRQFSGSQTAFFELQDKITRITASVVEGGNVTSILSASAIPSAQAQSQLSYDGSNVVAAIDQLGDRLVQVLGGQLVEIRENTTPGPVYGGSGGGGFNIPGFFAQNVKQI